MNYTISGIQQIGIGNTNVHKTWAWYRSFFGVDVPIFEEAATATLMLPYTGNQPQARHAVLAIHTQGGGGLEIWQYTQRTPQPCSFEVKVGDLGIFAAKFPCKNAETMYSKLKEKGAKLLGEISKNPAGERHFYLQDLENNIIEVSETPDRQWFTNKSLPNAGPIGVTIGVSNIEKSLELYTNILGYDQIIYDLTDTFSDFKPLNGGGGKYRRVLLRHAQARKGPFSQMFGASEIELVQCLDAVPRKIFANRFWGDCGYIHLCFDIQNMAALKETCAQKGFNFTVDSSLAHRNGFDMGEAAGHFSYIEDPDGTLIEFVETHKIPILKKFGWYLDLRKRNPAHALPKLMLMALALNRKKD